ncbi:hypothetical protein [Nostoc sp. UHCC 0870]|uniref:hypothetical protein n=1 Tax=Nostoc sp. UHCC 0870 TaxID=2914041 RepID=UPI001EDE48EA|nr:hypothetical protein [Nostoc sp. UHCC 0870]UKP01112.1 hypothetical protein L6494_27525 [Nostoc sp. UHCC 0870]
MSKVVAGKSLKKNYTPISNSLIRNSEIDDSTFRLICWMTSHDEGFEINFNNIQTALGYGRDKLRKILKNAEHYNYLVRRKIRTCGGLFDCEYHIFKDCDDAIAFRQSLPTKELTSDQNNSQFAIHNSQLKAIANCELEIANCLTRGVKTGGGQTGDGETGGGQTRGGRTRGGESTPLKEKQYKENQIKENKKREETHFLTLDSSLREEISEGTELLDQPTPVSQVEQLDQPTPVSQAEKLDQPTPVSQVEQLDQSTPVSQVEKLDQLTPALQVEKLNQLALDFQLEKPDQPAPKIHSLLPNQPESLQQKSDPAFGSIVAGSFDNLEQMNLTLASTQDTTEPENREVLTLRRYQQLDADGIPLKQWELRDWAKQEIGQYVKTYRKSGFILTGGNDVSVEFAVYVAGENCKRGQQPTISLGFSVINKCERDPRCWQKLVGWVTEWQQQRQSKTTVNVAAAVNHQQELDRIRQAASTKFEL